MFIDGVRYAVYIVFCDYPFSLLHRIIIYSGHGRRDSETAGRCGRGTHRSASGRTVVVDLPLPGPTRLDAIYTVSSTYLPTLNGKISHQAYDGAYVC